MYEQILSQAGLYADQAKIYEILIKNGPLEAGKIAKKTDITRSLVYKILEELIEKGLVLKDEQSQKVIIFKPEHPLKLQVIQEKMAQKAKNAQIALDTILPALSSDFNQLFGSAHVRFFEGKEGIIKLYEIILAQKAPIDSIEEKGDMLAFIPDYVPIFVKKRIAAQIPNRVISPENNPYNKTDPSKFIEAKLVLVEKFPFRIDIKICADKISLITFKKETAFAALIDDQEIADNFRILFNFIWSLL